MINLSRNQLLNAHSRERNKDEALTTIQIQEQLQAVADWAFVNHSIAHSIARTYSFKNYYETLAFVNAIAYVIHHEDHHPDLIVGYNRCEVRFNTHSVKGISLNDFICAAKCDAIFELAGPHSPAA